MTGRAGDCRAGSLRTGIPDGLHDELWEAVARYGGQLGDAGDWFLREMGDLLRRIDAELERVQRRCMVLHQIAASLLEDGGDPWERIERTWE